MRDVLLDTTLAAPQQAVPGWQGPIRKDGDLEVWRNPAYAGEARLLPALGGAVPTLRRSELGQRIDVESPSTAGGPSPAGPSAVGATGGVASLLVTDEQWDAGWSVEVDGQAATPRPVDGFFLGVELPPGARHATFRYRPVHARLGLAISAAGLALGVLLAAADGWPATLRRRRTPPAAGTSTATSTRADHR